MGSLQAQEMARLTDLDTALRWHLQSNHFPPVPLSMLGPCKQADAIVEGYHLEAFLDPGPGPQTVPPYLAPDECDHEGSNPCSRCCPCDECGSIRFLEGEGEWTDAMTGEPAEHDEECLIRCDAPEDEKCRALHSCWCSNDSCGEPFTPFGVDGDTCEKPLRHFGAHGYKAERRATNA